MLIENPQAVEKSIWRYLLKVGGCAYGVDWPTLRVTMPKTASVLQECHRRLYGRVLGSHA